MWPDLTTVSITGRLQFNNGVPKLYVEPYDQYLLIKILEPEMSQIYDSQSTLSVQEVLKLYKKWPISDNWSSQTKRH